MIEKQQSSNEYGISQELLVLSQLANYGTVSIPYGNSARYDCILDFNGVFYKIQIKSLNMLDKDTIIIPMGNSRITRKNGTVSKPYTSNEVDFIAISFNNWIYLFNPDLASKAFTVRVNKPSQYNQHWIEDYRIDKILNIFIKSWNDLKEEARLEHPSSNTKRFSCIDCGEPVWEENSRCVNCARLLRSANSAKPSREILKAKIKNTPFTRIGAEYNVSDNTVRKWCKTYDLPSKSSEIKEIIQKGEWDFI